MADALTDLMRACIEAKKGNKEFALFYFDPGWIAEIGNSNSHVMLGEAAAQFSCEGDTPEAAVQALLEQLEKAEGVAQPRQIRYPSK